MTSQASDVLSSLESGGYSPDASVAIEWPGSTLNFAGAEADTETVGDVVAGLAEDFYDGGSGLDHYNVHVDGTKNQEVAAGTTAATVSGLSSGTSYDFSVTAVDGAGNESSSSNTITVSTDEDSGWW